MSAIAERVDAGAAVMDVADPDWWREDVERAIDLDWLTMQWGDRCVLGQRRPLEVLVNHLPESCREDWSEYQDHRYEAYVTLLSGRDRRSVADWAAARGFSVVSDEHAEWRQLTDAWHDLIMKRRKDAVGGAA